MEKYNFKLKILKCFLAFSSVIFASCLNPANALNNQIQLNNNVNNALNNQIQLNNNVNDDNISVADTIDDEENFFYELFFDKNTVSNEKDEFSYSEDGLSRAKHEDKQIQNILYLTKKNPRYRVFQTKDPLPHSHFKLRVANTLWCGLFDIAKYIQRETGSDNINLMFMNLDNVDDEKCYDIMQKIKIKFDKLTHNNLLLSLSPKKDEEKFIFFFRVCEIIEDIIKIFDEDYKSIYNIDKIRDRKKCKNIASNFKNKRYKAKKSYYEKINQLHNTKINKILTYYKNMNQLSDEKAKQLYDKDKINQLFNELDEQSIKLQKIKKSENLNKNCKLKLNYIKEEDIKEEHDVYENEIKNEDEKYYINKKNKDIPKNYKRLTKDQIQKLNSKFIDFLLFVNKQYYNAGGRYSMEEVLESGKTVEQNFIEMHKDFEEFIDNWGCNIF